MVGGEAAVAFHALRDRVALYAGSGVTWADIRRPVARRGAARRLAPAGLGVGGHSP